jgi:hypothetical protein
LKALTKGKPRCIKDLGPNATKFGFQGRQARATGMRIDQKYNNNDYGHWDELEDIANNYIDVPNLL